MSVDLPRRLDRAYPLAEVEVPDPGWIWEQGRAAHRRRRVVRSATAAAAAVAAVAVLVAAVVLPRTGSDGSGPYIAGTETVDLSAATPIGLPDLPLLAPPDGELIVAALDGAFGFAESETTAWVPTPEAASGDLVHRVVGRGDRLVFYGGDGVYVIDGDVDAQPEAIATAQHPVVFAPSEHPQRVWVQDGGTDGSPRTVREVSVDGTVTVAPVTAPGGALVGAVTSGIVLQRSNGLAVWDPRTQRTVVEVDGAFLMGTSGDALAWCDQDCDTINITRVNSGVTRAAVELDGQSRFVGHSGRLSPGGRWLAAIACQTSDVCGISLVDLHHGGTRTYGLGTVPPDGDLEWSLEHDRLAVELVDDHAGMLHPDGELRRTDHPLAQDPYGQIHGIALVAGRLSW